MDNSQLGPQLMAETWLHPNRRAILFGCIPPIISAAIGAWIAISMGREADYWQWVGLILIGMSLCTIGLMINQLRRPRIAFRNGQVLFYVRSGSPIAVPAEIVEAFFLGQGPAKLPGM